MNKMNSDHDPSLTPAYKPPSLEKTLEKNQEVKEKLEDCVVELSTFNEMVKTEIAAGNTLQQMEKALSQNENVGKKMIECADEMHEINKTLAQEIDDRNVLNRELMATGRRLSATQEEKERLRVSLNHVCDAVITTDMSGNVTYLNTVAETMTGWTSQEAKGHALPEVFNIIHSQTNESAPNPVELVFQGKTDVGLAIHTLLIQRNGNTFDIEDSAAPIRDQHGTLMGAVLIFHDVTQARDMAAKMTHLASHDALTGASSVLKEAEACLLVAELTRRIGITRFLSTRSFALIHKG